MLEVDDVRPRVLVLAGSRRVALVATVIRTTLEARGVCAELGDASRYPPPPADYDAIMIGIAVGRRDRAIETYLDCFRVALDDVLTAVFFVGAGRKCERALRGTDLRPPAFAAAAFATPTWPWQRWSLDTARVARLVDDVVTALPEVRDAW